MAANNPIEKMIRLGEQDDPEGGEDVLDSEEVNEDLEPGYDAEDEDGASPQVKARGDAKASGKDGAEEAEPEGKDDAKAKPKDKEADAVQKKRAQDQQRWQKITRENRDLREDYSRLENQFSELRGLYTSILREREAKPPPDPQQDPEAYVQHVTRERDEFKGKVQTIEAQQAQTREQQEYTRKVQEYTTGMVEEFLAVQTDYHDAYNYLQQATIQERLARGDTLQGAQEFFSAGAWAEMERLYRTGGNPAKMVYALAKARGYKSPDEAGGDSSAEGDSAGKASPPPKSVGKRVEPAQGKARNTSVAGAGRTAETDLDSLDIDDMTNEQFTRYVKKLKDTEVKASWP